KVSLDLCLTHPVFWGTLFARGCSSGPPPQCSALRLGSLSYCWRAEPHLWRDEDRQFGARESLPGWSLLNGLGGGSHARRRPAVPGALPSSPCRCCDRRGAWCHPRADPAASSIQARGGVSTPDHFRPVANPRRLAALHLGTVPTVGQQFVRGPR